MKILFYIATWQRIEITKLCYQNLQHFISKNPQHTWQVMIVCSETEHIVLAKDYGFECCLTDNFPVGQKMNTGLEHCLKLEWDYIIQLGSDDVLNPEIMQLFDEHLAAGVDIIGVDSAVYIDMEQQRAKTFSYEDGKRVLGAGRLISRKAIEQSAVCQSILPKMQMRNGTTVMYRNTPTLVPLHMAISLINSGHATIESEQLKVNLWKPDANRALDHYSQKTLSAQGFEPMCIQAQNMVFDIKSETNVWAFDDLPGTPVPYDQAISFIKFP